MAGADGDTDILIGADGNENAGYENPAIEGEPRKRLNVQQELADVNGYGLKDNAPPPALWEDVIQEHEGDGDEKEGEDDEPKGNCCCRCVRGCGKCFNEAWAGCTTVDKALLFMHILIGCCSMGQIVAMAYVKIVSHNQCLLRANYNPDGTMTGGEKFWCDSSLYYSLISASLVFMFAMVNWTAQLNNNWRWMQIHLVLTILGTLGQLLTSAMFAMSYMVWCDVLHNSMHCTPGTSSCPKERQSISTCTQALEYFDNQINHDNLLQKVKAQSIIAMTVAALVCVLWIVLLGLLISKFCVVWFEVKKKREEEEEENARLEEEFKDQEQYDPTQGPPDDLHPFEIQCMERERRQRVEQERQQLALQQQNVGDGEDDDDDQEDDEEGYNRMLVQDGKPQDNPDGAANNLLANGQVHVADIHG